MLNLVFEKLDKVSSNGARSVVFGCVWLSLVCIIGFDDCHDLFWVDGDVRCSDSILRSPSDLSVDNLREIDWAVYMIKKGLRLGGRSVMVISWRPSNDGIAVLTSIMICNLLNLNHQ